MLFKLACMVLLAPNKHVGAQKHNRVLILQELYSTTALLLSLATITLTRMMTVDVEQEPFSAKEDLMAGMYCSKCNKLHDGLLTIGNNVLTNALL